jgi:hypothetical protein
MTDYRIAYGAVAARELVSSLFEGPGPRPEMAFGISNMDMLERHFIEFSVSHANPARLAAQVPGRFIYTTIKGPIYGRSDKRILRESRYLPPEQLKGLADLTIVGDTVVFMTEAGTDVVAQAVKNPELATMMVGFFNFLWAHAQ